MSELRVDAGNLDYLEGQTCIYQGAPFTGIAEERYVDGRLRSEVRYERGEQQGPARDWYANGALKSETEYRANNRHGRHREWFPDGRERTNARYEYGLELECREWDADGRQVVDRAIEPGSVQAQLLTRWRTEYGP